MVNKANAKDILFVYSFDSGNLVQGGVIATNDYKIAETYAKKII